MIRGGLSRSSTGALHNWHMGPSLALGFLAATALSALATVGGCTGHSNIRVCDCADQGLFIDLTPERSQQVAAIFVSGTACVGSHARCAGYQGTDCIRYFVAANAVGTCHVELSFKTGGNRLGGDVSFERGGDPQCCEGYYPVGSSTITLGEVKSDAGFD